MRKYLQASILQSELTSRPPVIPMMHHQSHVHLWPLLHQAYMVKNMIVVVNKKDKRVLLTAVEIMLDKHRIESKDLAKLL